MGHHVTILRSRGGVPLPIDADDVDRAASALPGWRYDRATGTLTSQRAQDRGLQVWLAEGALWARNPDVAALARLITLAGALGARVRGADGATYRTPYETYRHPDDATATPRTDPMPLPSPARGAPPGTTLPYRAIFWISLATALATQVVRALR